MTVSEARVLVVDDEPALCEIFAQWMTMAGCHSIRTARNGEQALAAVTSEGIDVLVSDVRMPVMDGVTLVRRLVELGHVVPTIIFVSGFGDVDQREMYGLGVEAFLSKPLRREDLMTVVGKALAERSELWKKKPEQPPRQELATGVGAGVRLGRGGFSVAAPTPLSQGRVGFRCAVEGEDRGGVPGAGVPGLGGGGDYEGESRGLCSESVDQGESIRGGRSGFRWAWGGT
jgi:CheY-like chemotaxis protein